MFSTCHIFLLPTPLDSLLWIKKDSRVALAGVRSFRMALISTFISSETPRLLYTLKGRISEVLYIPGISRKLRR
jgi:hypothetical protein